MTQQTYVCRRFPSVGPFRYTADMNQSAGNVMVSFIHHDDGYEEHWQPVPFQVADSRHNRSELERMIAHYFR